MEETSVIQLELEKEFGGTGPHLEVELEKVFQLLWSLLYESIMCTAKIAESASSYTGQSPLKKLVGLPHITFPFKY